LTIWRNGKAETMNVKLGTLPVEQALAARTPTDEKPEKMEPAFVEGLGISVEPNSDGPGLVVSEVENGSIAQERGLQPGDVIVAVNNSDVKSAADVAQLMDKASKDGRKAALFQVQRNNQNSFIALPIDQG
jgi:serine protease Do